MKLERGRQGQIYAWCNDDCLSSYSINYALERRVPPYFMPEGLLRIWCVYCANCGSLIMDPATNCMLHPDGCPKYLWAMSEQAAAWARQFAGMQGGWLFDDDWVEAEEASLMRPQLSGEAMALEMKWSREIDQEHDDGPLA